MRAAPFAGAALLFFLSSQPARATDPEPRHDFVPFAGKSRVALEYDYWSHHLAAEDDRQEPRVAAMSWALVGQIGLPRGAFLDIELPFAYASRRTDSGSGSGATLGSVVLGAHRTVVRNAHIAGHFGGGISIPTMLLDPPQGAALQVAELAKEARGMFDSQRFLVREGAWTFQGGFEWQIVSRLFLRMAFGHIFGIPRLSQTLWQSNELEARARFGLGTGLRLQEVFTLLDFDTPPNRPRNSDPDLGHVSVEPYLTYLPREAGLYARAGMLVAINPHLGPGVERGKVLTMRLSLGTAW